MQLISAILLFQLISRGSMLKTGWKTIGYIFFHVWFRKKIYWCGIQMNHSPRVMHQRMDEWCFQRSITKTKLLFTVQIYSHASASTGFRRKIFFLFQPVPVKYLRQTFQLHFKVISSARAVGANLLTSYCSLRTRNPVSRQRKNTITTPLWNSLACQNRSMDILYSLKNLNFIYLYIHLNYLKGHFLHELKS